MNITSAKNPDYLPPSVELKGSNVVLISIAIFGLFTANPIASVFAIIQLYVLVNAYWRQNTPPVMLLLFLIPWLEISTGVLEANIRRETLNSMLHGSGGMAYWMSALGLYAVHFGFYSFFQKTDQPSLEQLRDVARKLSLNRLIITYFAIGPATNVIAGLIGRGSGLYQFVTYLNEISLCLLIVICLRQAILKEITRTFLLFSGIVLVVSFYSFFSEWRLVLFAFFIAFGTIQTLTRRVLFRILFFAVLFGNIVFLWQGIKPLYRSYLTGQDTFTGGLQSQAVNRSRGEALAKFLELSREFYQGDLDYKLRENTPENEQLLYSTLRRIGYLEFMSLSMNNVPSRLEHEHGALLKSNISYALIPRILNPNKGVKDDGAKVEKYTEFMVAHASSFSLGHYVEYYIDFGRLGMLLVLFIYGIIGGVIFRFSSRKANNLNLLFTPGLIFVLLQQWGSYQNDAIWVYGLTFFGFLCHLFFFQPIYSVLAKFNQRT